MNRIRTHEGRWIRRRMGVVCGVLAFACGLVVSNGYAIMVRDGSHWRELAEGQRQRRLKLVPKRGTLYDRNRAPLAVSVDVPSVSLDAVELLRGVSLSQEPAVARQAASRIGEALGIDPARVEKRILRKRRFAWLKRRVTPSQVEAIRKLSSRGPASERISGLTVEGEGRRYYPQRELGASLLGFVSPDGKGLDGLELSLDADLAGHRELLRGLRDRSGRLLFMDGIQDEQSLAGHNILLTIDQAIQNIAEKELSRVARTFEAKSGSVVVVEPSTGEILAMASYPGYNPNDYRYSEPSVRRARAATDRFEPGSTVKIFTIAAGLEAGVIRAGDRLDCEGGSMKVDNVTIRDTHPAHQLSIPQILALSSNICAAKIGLKLGSERLHNSFRRFGFAQETGVPVPGETPGVLLPRGRPWVSVETATASYGQGFGVSNLQLAMATAAIANSGKLMEPTLIRRVESATGELVREAAPRVRRQIVSPKVARTVSEMLVAVTEGHGTGVEAALDGFSVAGKTGTAEKARTGRKGYSLDNYVASFVGFVPANEPRLAIAVMLDEPSIDHSGGTVAAPVFRRIAEASLNYMGVTPRGTAKVDFASLQGASDPARAAYEVARRERGEPSAVQEQRKGGAVRSGMVRVPDLTGVPVREAVRRGATLGLLPRVKGTGLLFRQTPAPGEVLSLGEAILLEFEPAS